MSSGKVICNWEELMNKLSGLILMRWFFLKNNIVYLSLQYYVCIMDNGIPIVRASSMMQVYVLCIVAMFTPSTPLALPQLQ